MSIIWKNIFFKETITISLKNEKLQVCFSTKTILFIGRIYSILKLPQFFTECPSLLPEIPKQYLNEGSMTQFLVSHYSLIAFFSENLPTLLANGHICLKDYLIHNPALILSQSLISHYQLSIQYLHLHYLLPPQTEIIFWYYLFPKLQLLSTLPIFN